MTWQRPVDFLRLQGREDLVEQCGDLAQQSAAVQQVGDIAEQVTEQRARDGRDVQVDLVEGDHQAEQVEVEGAEGQVKDAARGQRGSRACGRRRRLDGQRGRLGDAPEGRAV